MTFPANLRYTKDHEWISLEGNIATIGITEFAQSELGDIVYVDINTVGKDLQAEEVFGTVEAVKTVSDLFLPVAANILEVNPLLEKQPELVNSDPYGQGWMVKVTVANSADVEALLDAAACKTWLPDNLKRCKNRMTPFTVTYLPSVLKIYHKLFGSRKKYSESELVLLLKQKQQFAFSYLYDNYSGALLSVIVNIVSDTELANDVLQEVFIKIWKQIESYDELKGRLFTWMLNVARNASIDTLRSKGYQNSQQNRELTEASYDAGGTTQLQTDVMGLRKVVHQLKDEYKILIELTYFKGYTQDEISKMLSIPLGTVKTRLRTALIQLRTVIK